MNPLWSFLGSAAVSAVITAVVSLLIARQNRAASRDVAKEEATATVLTAREQGESEAYVRARQSLEGTIAVLERANTRLLGEAEGCATKATAQAKVIEEQGGRIDTLEAEVVHLRNQDRAKERIIDTMRGELATAQAALRAAYPDEP